MYYLSFVKQKLCSFWIMRSVWPSFMLRRNLRKEMVEIHMDDIALTREGIEILDEEQLKEVTKNYSVPWFIFQSLSDRIGFRSLMLK